MCVVCVTSMPPPTTASSSSLTTRGSGTSSIPPTPTGQPPTAAEPRGTALVEAGPSLSAGLGLAGAAEAMQLLSLEQQQQWHQQGVQQQQAQQSAFPPEAGRRMNYSPFGVSVVPTTDTHECLSLLCIPLASNAGLIQCMLAVGNAHSFILNRAEQQQTQAT